MPKSALPLALLLGAVGLAASFTGTTLEERQSFNVKPGGTLTVDVDRGSIDVTTSDNNTVDVQITRRVDNLGRAKLEDALKKHHVEISQNGDDIRVYSRMPSGFRRFWNGKAPTLQVRYRISVPKKYNVDTTTSGGGIVVSDLGGEARCKTSGGGLRLGAIAGSIWGRTSGGGIHVDSCQGAVDVETSGGGIDIGGVDGNVVARTSGGSIAVKKARRDVTARTSGGGITLSEVSGKIEASTSGGGVFARILDQPDGACNLTTSGGSMELQLAKNLAFDLDASASGGSVTSDFPSTAGTQKNKSELRTRVNGGGPSLVLRTSGGTIQIRKLQ